MSRSIRRSTAEPVREALSWEDLWKGPDRGLIRCWENGRQQRTKEPALAERAENGDLVYLHWARGTFEYLATWQGLRGENLDIDPETDCRVVCVKENKEFVFSTDDKMRKKRKIIAETPLP